MEITRARPSDLVQTVDRLTRAFATDPITGFLLQDGPGYGERLTKFFSLLMRARLALDMPVLVARDGGDIHGMAMGYRTTHPAWPDDIVADWDRFEASIPGLADRMSIYDSISERCTHAAPHYYLGVIGVDPALHGRGIGMQLLASFCKLSAADALSQGVYLETAQPSNVAFYERAGFIETGREPMGAATLWCMYLHHEHHDG